MKIGVHLNNGAPWCTAEAIVATADQAEALGFDEVWVADHVAMPVRVESPDSTGVVGRWNPVAAKSWWEPLTTLAHVSGRTSRVGLGIAVMVVAQRQPLVVAKQCATLDALSGGRLTLGVGVGWMREEFEALGADTYKRRGQATDEAIRICRSAWSADDEFSFDGRSYRFGPVRIFPKPARPGGPPIWIGGISRRALRRTAELGDGWYAEKLSPDELRARVAVLRELLAECGRSPERVSISIALGLLPPGAEAPRPSFGAELIGSPAEIAERIQQYAAVGVDHATLIPRGDSLAANLEAVDAFAREVRPLLGP